MKSLFYLALASFFSVNSAYAAVVSVPVTDSGWYTKPGVHVTSIKNYFASEDNGQRSFFTFDLSGVDVSAVTSATFNLNTYDISASGVLTLFDVSTAPSLLSAQSGVSAAGAAINADLGSGNLYAVINLTAANSNTLLNIALNSSFLSDLQASNGFISIGGVFKADTTGSAFGNSAFNTTNALILNVTPVPELPVSAMMMLGLIGFGLSRKLKY